MTKTVNNATPLVGSQVTFEVVITNDGPQTATGVQVTDLLPDGYTYNSFSATTGTYNSTTGLWNVGILANGESETLLVMATVNTTGNYENVAEVTASSQPDTDSTPDNGVNSEDDYASVITTPIATASDLSVTKTVNNATPLVGTNVTFTITVSNDGSQDATGVTVTDLLHTGYTFVSSTATTGAYNDATGLWTVGSVATGSFETLQLTVTINATGDYENIAEVTASDLPDPDSTPNNGVDTEDDYASVVTTPVAQSADLSVTKTVNNATPLVGTQVTFSIQVTNAGPEDTSGVTVTDLLPTGYTYVSYTATAGAYDSVTGLWTVGNLDSGVFHTLQVTATVNGSGDYTNIAEVTSNNLPDPDSTPGNVIDTEDDYASVSTVPIPISADLSITKTVNHPTPLVGSGVVFTITVTNDGPQDATGVQVTDLLPSGYSFIVATTTSGIYNNLTGIWEVGTVASGVSETLLINASVLPSGDYLNVAEITASDTPDPDSTPGNGLDTEDDYASIATIPIAVSADLSITKTVNNPTPLVGSGVIFEIIVTNDGPQTATGVVVTDLLPSGYSYVVATTTGGIYNSTTGEWVVGTMPSGTSETLLINGIVQSTGDYLNIAEITSSNEPDPDSTPDNGIDTEDDYASAITVPIAVSADLSITKTVNNPTPLVGNGVVFTITVTNDGPQTATGVVVTDLLPSGYTFVVATTTGGIYNSTIGEWSVGTLPSGTSETLLINAIVQPTGDYLNVAEITSSNEPDSDSTPGNGIDTEDDYASVTTVPIAVFADLSLTKTANNPTPIIGGGVTFEIIVTNDGPQTATGVVVTDLLPSGYSYVIASSTDGVYNSNTGEWLVSALPAGASQTLLINATVQSTGDYLNVAEITSSNEADPDSTPGNGVDTEDDYATAITTPIIPTADLELSKTIVGGNATPLVGSQIIFNIEVSNAGPASATGVVIEDVLPSGYTFVSYNATEGIYNSVNGLWTIGDPLISGASISLQITAVVNSTGDYLNIAEIFSSDVLDPDSTPNNGVTTEDDYGSVSTIPIPLVADLSLTKTVNNATPLVGSQVTFEVVITNDGPQTTTGVQVTDLLPDGYTYNSFTATAGTYTSATGLWNIGVLNNGQSVSLQVTATINATGDYENIAEVTASDLPDPDSTPANGIDTEDDYSNAVTTPVATAADLSITKTVNNATPLVGTNITFTVTVSNDGPQDATGVTVTDLLPTGYTFVSSTATIGAYNDVTGLWTVGSIATGSFETLQLTATVNTTGDYENIVEVTASDLPDPDSTPANGLDTEDDYASAVTTPIALAADLAITKTVNNAMPLVGSQVIFEIIVTNDGPQTATGVQVTDLLPEGYTYNSFTATAGTYAAVTGLWNIGVLTNGQSVSLQVTATVNATGGYENIAEVTTSDLPDPDSTPNNGIDNEDDYASAVTTPIATAADLSITKTVNNATPLVGSQVTFEVVITNDGPQTATGVQVTDLLPDGYSYNSFSATTGTYNNTTGLWNVGSLANGESETLLVTATVNTIGDYENIVEVTASNLPDPDSTPNNGIDIEDDYASATTTPVATAADLSVTKTVNNATPLVGSQVIFEVVITNDGPQTTTGVQVTDLLPDGYTYNSFSATTGTYNSTTGLWNVGTLGNGESETLQVTTTVNATGNYENIAEVTASNLPDTDSTPNNGIDTEDDYASISVTPATVFADLSITKNTIDGNTSYNVGALVVFGVTVTNDGPGVATGVVVEDLLPSGFSFLSYTATSGVYNNTTGVWTTGAVLSGGTQTLLVYSTVNVPTGNTGEYTNIAEIMQSDVSDPDSTPGNVVTTEDDYASLDIIVEMADLSLEKTVSNITANVGETLVFTIQINNDGPTTATGVAVEDIVPVGYYNISNVSGGGIFNGYTITWQGLTVPLSGVTLTYEATVYDPAGLNDEDYKNIAQITASDQFDIDSTPDNDDGDQSEDDEDAAFIEVPRTDIGITKTVDNAEPAMNSLVSFTITAENLSALEATNVIVSDALPNGYEFDSYTASTGDYNPLTGVWSISQIAGNSSETLVITAKVVDNSNYLNIARLESLHQVDYNPDNDEGSASVSPKCLDIYNEFSPNGDGDNDTFYIDCITNYPNNVLRIYSRWGDEVFSAKGYDNTWTGTSDGPEKTLPVGTYFYILDLGDGSEEIQGWLYLKR
ncbi:gliding motility-associated C-terminal domain-containing protein [Flavobacterium alkalisoli]|uniref:T9SS type B sorting domain-containing protein n=1 Tax=Flavobacterium alkalisoli TaxID=2602769 RepID=UPI003A8EA694